MNISENSLNIIFPFLLKVDMYCLSYLRGNII